ncbi:DNA polymerase III subunit beta [Fictibacillus arsenicus]|uniref:Beta sliding clamp n=1 Tax=Fictibacillus arsenicus TaxID=255247 RepID=A0A1V3G8E5_9BACL|nr:DNA polymerase III subunit beta [Fictibacillus arsenicus]OOE12679.1 DNA polymerase III subunit beta [Fictibacillus arsenicus]
MEFIIAQSLFSKALSDVSKAVSSRTLLPILSGIKIVAGEDGITLIGSNSDIIIERTISVTDEKVKINKTGSIVVSAKYLTELVKKLPEQIHIKTDNNQIYIQAGTISTKLNGIDAEEYPSLPIIVGDSIHISAQELKDAVKTTGFAAARNETRPVLTGVNLIFSENSFTSVATDSQRLAFKKSDIQSSGEGSFVVPKSSIDELAKLVNHYSGMVEIQSAEGYIHFKTNEISLYSRLIAGHYPNTSVLIPNEVKTTLVLCKETLIKGIDRACLFAGEWKNNNVVLSINEHKLAISSGSSEMGSIEELQEIKAMEGESDLKISVDGHFLLDALKTINDGEIKVKFSGSMKPIVIESAKEESPYLHLISPVRSF